MSDEDGDRSGEPLLRSPIEAVHDVAAQESPWAALRQQYERNQVVLDVLDLAVPGFGGDLLARYEKPDNGDVKAITRTVELERRKNPEAEIGAAADFLCRTLLGLRVPIPEKFLNGDANADPTRPLEPGRDVRYDSYLAGKMGMEGAEKMDGRAVVRRLFGGDKAGAAILSHFEKVMSWAQGDQVQEAERAVGESPATPS